MLGRVLPNNFVNSPWSGAREKYTETTDFPCWILSLPGRLQSGRNAYQNCKGTQYLTMSISNNQNWMFIFGTKHVWLDPALLLVFVCSVDKKNTFCPKERMEFFDNEMFSVLRFFRVHLKESILRGGDELLLSVFHFARICLPPLPHLYSPQQLLHS